MQRKKNTRQVPNKIQVHKKMACVELTYGSDSFLLSYEYLRVFSPSAEVRGHGIGNEVLQVGKKDVGLIAIEPAGNYALKLVFDDGHDSGLYDWAYLHHLATQQESLWQEYLDRLEQAGASRQAVGIQITQI